VAQNVAHSDCNSHRQEAAPAGFQHGPAPTAHTCHWPKKGAQGEGLVRLEVDERKCAGRTSPALYCVAAPSFMPHPTAVLHWAALGHRMSTPSFCALAAHLLQQFVDERASEHVEKVGSKPSMDA
jgi:hypothetical protein